MLIIPLSIRCVILEWFLEARLTILLSYLQNRLIIMTFKNQIYLIGSEWMQEYGPLSVKIVKITQEKYYC